MLSHFQASRGGDNSENDAVLDALLTDMIEKTSPKAINIEPDDDYILKVDSFKVRHFNILDGVTIRFPLESIQRGAYYIVWCSIMKEVSEQCKPSSPQLTSLFG